MVCNIREVVFSKTHLSNRAKTFIDEPEHWLCFEDELEDTLIYEIGEHIRLIPSPYLILEYKEKQNESNSIPKFGICS